MGGEVPPGEQPNLEYARKATDLVLEYLKDQQSDPDEDLLKKLGWTKENLEDFVRRWADLKRTAREDPRARQQLDDAHRLGLRPAARDPRRSDVRQDTRRRNVTWAIEAGHRLRTANCLTPTEKVRAHGRAMRK